MKLFVGIVFKNWKFEILVVVWVWVCGGNFYEKIFRGDIFIDFLCVWYGVKDWGIVIVILNGDYYICFVVKEWRIRIIYLNKKREKESNRS